MRTFKRMIFCVTTGRSGTGYLARLMAHSPGVTSRHEPDPSFVTCMSEAIRSRDAARRFWLEKKLPAIESVQAEVYCETSHLFCKGFVEALLQLGVTPNLVILRRNPRQVARSLTALGTVPCTEAGRKWLLSPDDPGVLMVRGWKQFTPYQLCYWYTLEIERRAQLYGRLVSESGGRVVEVTLDELQAFRGVIRLFKGLEVHLPRFRGWRNLWRTIGAVVNDKRSDKEDLVIAESEAIVQEAAVLESLTIEGIHNQTAPG